MNQYLYETHLHTREASACATSWAIEYIDAYLGAGYSGIIVTDHFFNGNTNISSHLSWEKQVHRFARGYERAKEAGEQAGLAVFFGWEACFGDDEYLIYGLDKGWLLDHPQIMRWDQATLFDTVDRAGGLMIQAHPFRERSYNWSIQLHPDAVHGVEVVNGANDVEENQRARLYAQEHDLLMTSGTDIHSIDKVGPSTRGMGFDYPLSTIEEFIQATKERHYTLLDTEAHRQIPKRVKPRLPVFLHERQSRSIG